MAEHVLDRPVWSALSTRQARHGQGGDLARRFAPDISPFVATRDDSPAALAALAALLGPADRPVAAQADAADCPPGWRIAHRVPAVQMWLDTPTGGKPPRAGQAGQPQLLTPADGPEMLALATLTRPGPFLARTPVLGRFWGIRRAGQLVAMAGERLQQPGFTEVSGVCTHPTAQGQGLGSLLCLWVAAQIQARGDTPYLHAYQDNVVAVRLYTSLGFGTRRVIQVTQFEPA